MNMEKHPYNDIDIPSETRLLIVGTAPPPRFYNFQENPNSYDFDFFYGSESNSMWPFLEQILEKRKILLDDMTSAECRVAAENLIKKHNIWMRDVLRWIKRKNGKENSAADSHIETPTVDNFEDFRLTLSSLHSLKSIATTSEIAFTWLIEALKNQGILCIDQRAALKQWKLPVDQPSSKNYNYYSRPVANFKTGENSRSIGIFILPSPSSRSAGLKKEYKMRLYVDVFKASGVI